MGKRILLGVIITDCHVDFQEEIMRGIITQAFKSSCDVAVIAPLNNFSINSQHRDYEKTVFDLILSPRFDGFIYDRNTFCSEDVKKYIDELLRRSGKPVMLLDYNDHKSFETTSVDDSSAFETITDHLIEVHGHRNIYCLTGPKKNFGAEERLEGFRRSMKKHGLDCGKNNYGYGDYWVQSAQDLAADILSGRMERPDAIVCGNDIMALTVCKSLITGGLRVPEDIAVTGYDASDDGYRSNPTITSYSRPNFQLGAESCRRLYRIITGKICSRVRNESGKLRLGRSCGCQEDNSIKHGTKRRMDINSSFESGLLYGDMLFDITNTDNVASFADRLDNYTYFLYKLCHINISLTRRFIEATEGRLTDNLRFQCGDQLMTVLSKSAVKRKAESGNYYSSADLIPELNEDRSYPSAFYISPLHYNDDFFGISAVSFGKVPTSFSNIYIQWINYVNIALEQLMIKSIMKNTIQKTNQALLYDSMTGLLNRSGIEKECQRLISGSMAGSNAEFITVELSGLKKMYFQAGEKRCNEITAYIADALRSCLYDDEICGVWSPQTFCVITMHEGRASEFFGQLSSKVNDSRFDPDKNFNVDFSVGVYEHALNGDITAADAMYKSIVNRLHSYTISEANSNPQFEKLCLLRNRIMKNPELPWNISEIADSLYLSKSYLQKIYKTYFNKSIIEEMISFRIENARKLLEKTDMTITDISRKCGYSSYNYFVRQFRNSEGLSPSEYRERYRMESVNNEKPDQS